MGDSLSDLNQNDVADCDGIIMFHSHRLLYVSSISSDQGGYVGEDGIGFFKDIHTPHFDESDGEAADPSDVDSTGLYLSPDLTILGAMDGPSWGRDNIENFEKYTVTERHWWQIVQVTSQEPFPGESPKVVDNLVDWASAKLLFSGSRRPKITVRRKDSLTSNEKSTLLKTATDKLPVIY